MTTLKENMSKAVCLFLAEMLRTRKVKLDRCADIAAEIVNRLESIGSEKQFLDAVKELEFEFQELKTLKNDLLHYSYETFSEYWKKAMTYTSLTAQSIKLEKTNFMSRFLKYMIYLPIYTFFNIYVRHRGYVDSWQGFLFAKFSALHFPIAYIKSLKYEI